MKAREWRLLVTACVALLLLVVLLLALIIRGQSRNVLLIENHSGQVIRELSLEVCGACYTLVNISDNREEEIEFDVDGDGEYVVSLVLDDGTELRRSFGYVTGGVGSCGNRAKVGVYSADIRVISWEGPRLRLPWAR